MSSQQNQINLTGGSPSLQGPTQVGAGMNLPQQPSGNDGIRQPQNVPGPQQPVRPGPNEQQEMPLDPYYDIAQQSLLNEM